MGTGSTFLRLWVSGRGLAGSLLHNLELIVTFIATCYSKRWLDIKVKNSWLDAPRHILTQLRCVQRQDAVMKDAVMPYIKSSA